MKNYNETLHKRSLARKFRVLRMIERGINGSEIAAIMNITHQRVYQLAKEARKLRKQERK